MVSGAQDIQITAVRRGEWLISYRAPTTQPAWYEALGRELEQQGWQAIDLGRYDNLKANYMRPSRGHAQQFISINDDNQRILMLVLIGRREQLRSTPHH